jgi:uncharacterized protein (TIGR02147 family)
MAGSIFEQNDYKAYLREELHLRGQAGAGRGERSRLASAIHCHTAYVSQVLNGEAHFSLEQAELVSRFLSHGKDEAAYFLALVQFNRAGTVTLKAHFEEQMRALAGRQTVLKNRLEFKRTLSREDQMIFYSSWHYGAIHVLVSLPGCNDERGIARYLNLPLSRVSEILDFLTSVGLVMKKEGRYFVGTSHIHLEHDSPMISKHHTNWRMKTVQSLDSSKSEDLHYSSVITCAQEDSPKIKAALLHAIDEVRGIVKPSKDESAFAYCIDFFGLSSEQK